MRFTYGSFQGAVRTQESTHVAWLAEFLSPWFSVGAEVAHTVTVTFQTMPGAHEEAAAAWTRHANQTEVDCFVLDSRVVRHPAWRDLDGGWTIVDHELDAIYRVAPDAARVEVVAGGGPPAGRVALMRVVRELATAEVLRSGALLLHAAALVRDGQGILLIGPKRAGKTTLLLRALATPGTAFMANDRVVAGGTRDTVARGMPSIVSVRPEVLTPMVSVAARFRALGYHHTLTMAEARGAGSGQPPGGGADLSPAQLCDLLGVRATAAAPLRAMVFPFASPGLGQLSLKRLSAPAALLSLMDGLFGGHATPVSEVFARSPRNDHGHGSAAEQQCRLLLAHVPAFACRFDPTTLDDSAAARLIDHVLG
jgi:hypothetical protein